MKKIVALALLAGAFGSAMAQPNLNVSVDIHRPGVYGRVRIGDVPPPALVMPQPVVIVQPRTVVQRSPVYLYVPSAHQQDWRRYCGRYAACGQPVYFVRDEWVRERYAQAHPQGDRGRHRGWDKHDDRGRGHDKHKHKNKQKGKHGRDD